MGGWVGGWVTDGGSEMRSWEGESERASERASESGREGGATLALAAARKGVAGSSPSTRAARTRGPKASGNCLYTVYIKC